MPEGEARSALEVEELRRVVVVEVVRPLQPHVPAIRRPSSRPTARGAPCSRRRGGSGSVRPRGGRSSAPAPPGFTDARRRRGRSPRVRACRDARSSSTAGARSIQSSTTSGRPVREQHDERHARVGDGVDEALLVAGQADVGCASSPRPRSNSARPTATITRSLLRPRAVRPLGCRHRRARGSLRRARPSTSRRAALRAGRRRALPRRRRSAATQAPR